MCKFILPQYTLLLRLRTTVESALMFLKQAPLLYLSQINRTTVLFSLHLPYLQSCSGHLAHVLPTYMCWLPVPQPQPPAWQVGICCLDSYNPVTALGLDGRKVISGCLIPLCPQGKLWWNFFRGHPADKGSFWLWSDSECWLHGAGHKSANYFLTLFTCALCSKVCLATGPTIWSGVIFSMQNVFLYPLWEGGLGKPCWPKSKLFAHENKNLVRSIILCIKAPTARACNRVRTRWVRQFPIHPFWAVIS